MISVPWRKLAQCPRPPLGPPPPHLLQASGAGPSCTQPTRMPEWIDKDDERFGKDKAKRVIRCDRCGEWFRGNNVGAFLHTHKLSVRMRLNAWRARRWDATWYCVDCHRENDESVEDVKNRLGMTNRMSAKTWYTREGGARHRCSGGCHKPSGASGSSQRPIAPQSALKGHHERCQQCGHPRDLRDTWNVRCQWCAGWTCSQACLEDHHADCSSRRPGRAANEDPTVRHLQCGGDR